MLRELYIENLAIIEKCNIVFDKALNVFSGETGAGKSILIGGINAVLGGRTYKDIVRNGAEKAVVTALFGSLPANVCEKLSESGYGSDETSDELVLTREIAADGKSAARVNGKPATAAVLKEIASGLIDIHGQHDTRLLTDAANQLEILDGYGNISLTEYVEAFRAFSALSRKIKQLSGENELREDKIALLTERIAALEPYKLKKGEREETAAKLERARNARNLTETLSRAYNMLNGVSDAAGAIELVRGSKDSLAEAAELIPKAGALSGRLNGALIELIDIKDELSPLADENDFEPELPYLEERMSDLLRLERKFGVDADGLVDKIGAWQAELDELRNGGGNIEKLIGQKRELGETIKILAAGITAKRRETADRLTALIRGELIYLDMPDVRLRFDIKQEKVTVTGMDSAELFISVNKGEELKPLSRVASGGELSRVMLAIKSVLAESDNIGTMIFDEIDSGISGRAAHKVGVKLSELAKRRQVLCVTHLAQIAAMADNHLLIEKASAGKRTVADVRRVDGEERKLELARIISGDEDELSLANAERLIGRKNA